MSWILWSLWACSGSAVPSDDPNAPTVDDAGADDLSSTIDSSAYEEPTGTASPIDTGFDVPEYEGPATLSATELYADLGTGVLADHVVPFDIRYPLWSDGATKHRFLYVPPGEVIDTSDPDNWRFPVGTVAFKEFVRDGIRVETRRFAKLADDRWDYATYVWRADGSDADAVDELVEDVLGTDHDVPRRVDCQACHVGPADLFLGVGAVQLSPEDQALLPLSGQVAAEVPGEGTTQEALGWMHGNCSSCHRDGALAGDRSGLWLDVRTGDVDPLAVHAVTTTIGKRAQHELFGTELVVVPQDPEASQLWVRLGYTSPLVGMPPVGRELVDEQGIERIADWILTLPD